MKRRWLVFGPGLLLAVVCVLLLRPAPRPLAAVPPSVPVAAQLPQEAAPASSASPARAASAAGPAMDASSAPGPDGDFVEICGVGSVKRSEFERERGSGEPRPAWAQAMDQQYENALGEVLGRLSAGTTSQRVAAAVMRGDLEGAALLAHASGDWKAYRLALRACRKDRDYRSAVMRHNGLRPALAASGIATPELAAPGPEPAACAALSLERLEAMDPGDASPWLLRLSDSQDRADAVGVSEALFQIAQRSRLSGSTRPLGEAVLEVVGDEPTLAEVSALVAAVGIDAASTLDDSLLLVGRSCRANALRDANLRQLCGRVVQRMPDLARDVNEAGALYSLEERLGLAHGGRGLSPEDRQRVLQAFAGGSLGAVESLSCSGMKAIGRQAVNMKRVGELRFARALLMAGAASAPH